MTEPEQPNYGPYGSYGGGGGTEYGQPIEDARPGDVPPGFPPPPPPYGTGQWQYGAQPGYQQPYHGYGYPQPTGTNGLAIASMVCGLCGFLCLVPAVVGVILGAVSLPQIKHSGQSGRGMAITGIVAGSVWVIGFVLLVILTH